MILVNLLYGMEWHPHLTRSLIFICIFWCTQCVHLRRMCVDVQAIKIIGEFRINYHHGIQWWWTPHRDIYFSCFKPDIISLFPLILHAYTDLKYIFPDFLCRNGLPFTKENSISIITLWWCLVMVVGKGILLIVFDVLISFGWTCPVWWVFMVRIWILLNRCRW